MVAIRHMGSRGSALKSGNTESRNNEIRSLSPSPLPTDIDLCCNNLLYHLCYGYCRGAGGDTSMLLFNGRCNRYKYRNITGSREQPFLCYIDRIWILVLYLSRPVSLCSIKTACCSVCIRTMIICSDV